MSVSFGAKALPTKIEFLRIQRSLSVSRAVYKILEDKREILLRRLDEIIGEASKARNELWEPLSEAYQALYNAYLKIGPLAVDTAAATIPTSIEVTYTTRRVVDVDVPSVEIDELNVGCCYGFADTNSDLDIATMTIRKTLPIIFKAAETETAIFRLANELRKTQRLLNALEYIVIPNYEESLRFISSTLEQREREEFVRLKHVKKMLEKRRTETVT